MGRNLQTDYWLIYRYYTVVPLTELKIHSLSQSRIGYYLPVCNHGGL